MIDERLTAGDRGGCLAIALECLDPADLSLEVEGAGEGGILCQR